MNRNFENTTKALSRTTVLTLVLCLAFATPLLAQATDDATRLKDQIDRNAELLQQASELVAETNSAKARSSLSVAQMLHEESVKLYDQGAGSGNLLRAAQAAQKAREAILQTIALAKRETRLEESAKKAIERATFRLEQGRQLMQNTAGDVIAPRKLLEEARGQLQRAQHNMREHLYEVALRLAVSSEELSARAIALIKRDVTDADWVARELEKTDRVIERLAEQAGDHADPQALRMLDEAQSLQRRAKSAVAEGNPRIALELTDKARQIAMRGLRLLSSKADRENVERAIALTDQLIDRAREIAVERDAGQVERQIAQAARLQDEAKSHFRQEDYEQALRLTLRARDLLRDALGGMARDLDPGEIEMALQGTDEILTRAREAVDDYDNELAAALLERADAKQKQAWEAFRQERLRAALANTRLARRMAQRAVAVAHGDEQ